MLGNAYTKGTSEVPQNFRIAAELFKKGCDAECVYSCYLYGEALLQGKGVTKDPLQAFRVLDKVCKSPQIISMTPFACIDAGDLLLARGVVAVTRDRARVVDLFHRACVQRPKLCVKYEILAGTHRPAHASPPQGVLGFRFGASVSEAKKVCSRHGGQLARNREQHALFACSARHEIPGAGLTARGIALFFCHRRLCGVAVEVPLPTENVVSKFYDVKQILQKLYAAPTWINVEVPGSCSPKTSFATCIASKRSTVEADWDWTDKHVILLSVNTMPKWVLGSQIGLELFYASPAFMRERQAQGL